MSDAQNGWHGILAEGETILWQGRPAPGIHWRDLFGPHTLMGVFFTGFVVVWMAMAGALTGDAPADDPIAPFFPLFGLPFLLIGLYLLIGRLFWDSHTRARTWYTLTDRAAYIASDIFGRRGLKRHGIDEMTRLDLDDAQPGSVWFADKRQVFTTSRRSGGIRHSRRHTRIQTTPIGFRRIDEARKVYRLIADRRNTGSQSGDTQQQG